MGDFLKKLSDAQIDALKELGNIGAGNAATALSEILNTKIDMTVPSVKIIPIEKVPDAAGGMETVVGGVYMRMSGDAPSNLLFVVPVEGALSLMERVLGYRPSDYTNLKEIEISALVEIGNIMCGSYINTLVKFTHLNMRPNVPYGTIDMTGALLSEIIARLGEVADYALLIETIMSVADESSISAYFFLLPDPEALRVILESLGMM
ncbi:MAG: chemotaxis protein CheC [Thermotogae bacterium]|nr:chemotaxis protein CheC [Thermotogota bacterium]